MHALFERHRRAVLCFSAGKDSLACLMLLKDYWHQLDVVWANAGAPHEQTKAYMQSIAERVPSFIELTGDQPAWISRHGWPVDIVPVRCTTTGELGAGPAAVRFQPYFSCCQANMWGPLKRYIDDSQHTLVIMGQRRDETLKNRLRDEVLQVIDGIEYFQPINEWTSSQAFDFIKSQGELLPPFYAQGAESSADCWNCTAYLDHNQKRLQHMRLHEPIQWAVIEPVLMAASQAIRSGSAPLETLISTESTII